MLLNDFKKINIILVHLMAAPLLLSLFYYLFLIDEAKVQTIF